MLPVAPQLHSFARPVTYMRISVTDRCNLRCIYCMPAEGLPWLPRDASLSYDEIETIVRCGAELGVSKLRLTGGEPTARPGIVGLVERLANIPGIDDIAMTTNGVVLARMAYDLKNAGLRRVNISLDTFKRDRFFQLARRDQLAAVLKGIDAARDAGLGPIKINMVVWKGINDDEIVDFARTTLTEDWSVRFIELMPFNDESGQFDGQAESLDGFLSSEDILGRIRKEFGPLEFLDREGTGPGNGPARYYRIPGAKGMIGTISPMSDGHFCETCNKIRLTADGLIRPCLLSDLEVDLRGVLRHGGTGEDIKALLRHTVRVVKPDRHYAAQGIVPEKRKFMAQIGG